MTEELYYKYLNFITVEVDRYVKDGNVTDDELIAFSIEIGNFKERVKNSQLNKELKDRVNELSYRYTRKNVKRSGVIRFILWIGTSLWLAFLFERKQQNERIADLELLKSQANSIMMYMKMNY